MRNTMTVNLGRNQGWRVTALGVAVFLVLGGATGCQARKVEAAREAVSAAGDLGVQSFPAASLSFNDSQLFMWKKGASREDVARVLANVSNLETVKDELFVMRQRRSALVQALDAVKLEGETVDLTRLREREQGLPEKQADLASLKSQLEELVKSLPVPAPSPTPGAGAAPAPGPAVAPETEAQIESLKKKIRRAEKAIADVDKWLKAIDAAGLSADYSEWKDLSGVIEERETLFNDLLAPIDETVWVFNSSPIRFHFGFEPDRSIRVAISNWDLSKINDPEIAEEGVARDFSTDLFTVGRVTYSDLGGVFTFEVYTPGAVYFFKIARNRYHAIDRQVHYKGDIVRCSVVEGFGRPKIVYVRDFVRCGVDTEGLRVAPHEVGRPELRRGAASLNEQADKG
jgi:hypothetical protein